MAKCEKCLYRKNCQFLATHKKVVVENCTAFESEVCLKSEVAMEIIKTLQDWYFYENEKTLGELICELRKKYTEENDE